MQPDAPPRIADVRLTCFHHDVYEPGEARPPCRRSAATTAAAATLLKPVARWRAVQDSFALVDALEADLPLLRNVRAVRRRRVPAQPLRVAHLTLQRALQTRVCVEVGCGTGYVITSAALLLQARAQRPFAPLRLLRLSGLARPRRGLAGRGGVLCHRRESESRSSDDADAGTARCAG
jgi:hypothetical protein